MEEEDASPKIQAHQTGIKKETRRRSSRKLEGASQARQTKKRQETRRRSFTKPLKETFKKVTGRSISRCTRSQVAPKWTKKETMILLNEMASQDHELAKALPSIQRWKIVAEGCGRMIVNRSSNDCRRRWDSLLTERNKIREWESSKSFSEMGSYWSLKYSEREKFQLPASFDEDVFDAVEGVIEVQEALCGFKEPIQVSDEEVENDKNSVDTDVNDDSDANDYSDANDDSDANGDSDANDDSYVSDDSDDDPERPTTETESSDLNVRGVRNRAIKGWRKVSAETFDTKMSDDSLDSDVDADVDAGADADADAGANADAVEGTDTEAVAGADAEAVAGADTVAGGDAVAGADADGVASADAGTNADADAAAGADAGTNANAYSEKKEIGTTKLYSKEQEMANKLRENAKQIQAILKGEVPDNVGESQIDSTKPNSRESEFINRQAGELIKSFEVLVSNFDQFNNLINEGSCEGINFIKPSVP